MFEEIGGKERRVRKKGAFATSAPVPCEPSAVYTARGGDLILLCANAAFYDLMGCGEEELRDKYGNRLCALFDGNSARAFDEAANRCVADQPEPIRIKQQIRKNGVDVWLHTEAICVVDDEGPVFHCVSFDMTEYEEKRRTLDGLEDTISLLARQIGMDCFLYETKTRTAAFYSAGAVVPAELFSTDRECHDFPERMVSCGLVPAEYEKAWRGTFNGLQKDGDRVVRELKINLEGHPDMWARLTLSVKKDGVGAERYALGTLSVITQEKEAARRYLNETQFYQAMLSEKDAYAQLDVTEDRITRIGGMWNLYNEIIDKVTYSALILEFINKVVHPEDRRHYLELMQCDNFMKSLADGIDKLGCEFRRIVDQNKMMWMQLSVHLFRDATTQHVLALMYIKNIDAKKKQEMLLLNDSRRDQLTNVYNRKMAEETIKERMREATPNELCAFMILDVDNFKQINDSFGHKAGDDVLIRLANILSGAFRRSDIIGRFGGDEFIIFLNNIMSEEKVIERLNNLYSLLGSEADADGLKCSVGVSIMRGRVDYEQMFRRADLALYQAKSAGKNCFIFFREGDTKTPDGKVEHTCIEQKETVNLLGETQASAPVLPVAEFDAFISDQGDIAYLVEPDTFDLICGNKAFYDRLGLTAQQCFGMKCYEAMQKRISPCPFCSKANWSTDKFYLWRNLNHALEQEFLIKNKLVVWGGKEVMLALAVDISNNKSIVDSLDNGEMESHSILSGVQRMAEAKTLNEAMQSALETIGSFFRADAVRLWRRDETDNTYRCAARWHRDENDTNKDDGQMEVSTWLGERTLEQSVTLESQEAMLCHSYDMYELMKRNAVRNQRWIKLDETDEGQGCIEIDNVSSNFQNVAFMESFSVFFVSELRKRRLIENALYANQYDDLTNLLSRKSFEETVASYDHDRATCVGVVMANFDDLKGINSAQGFSTGNYMIGQLADMLREAFGEELVFRLNGDEFLVIAVDVGLTLLEEKIGRFEEMIRDRGDFTVSIGYSWDNVEKDVSVLIEQATQTMKINKKRHYDSAPVSGHNERRKMLNGLLNALENREFEVFMQPKVELLHNKVIGAEALVRYRDKERGLIQPSQFIELLEKNNLIRFVDLFVFEEVCKQLEMWKAQGANLPVVSLNFSRLTLLEKDILASMEAIIARYDAPKKHVEIEITESVADMGKSVLYQAAYDLYQAGFAISLDDFGTKYTNLSILADIDFSMLKLDKSLVGSLGSQPSHQLILKNIIYMCKDLGIGVIAEGVETKRQEQILRDMQCQMGQGYLYGKPIPTDEFYERYIQPQH